MPPLSLSKFETIDWITDEMIKVTTILQIRGTAIQNNSIRKQSMAAIYVSCQCAGLLGVLPHI